MRADRDCGEKAGDHAATPVQDGVGRAQKKAELCTAVALSRGWGEEQWQTQMGTK